MKLNQIEDLAVIISLFQFICERNNKILFDK